MELLKIGEVAKLLGVTTATLRNWHKSGELVPTKITKNGNRYYLKSKVLEFFNMVEDENND